ncbi:hypothetical protein Tcan_06597 [Toxocara canis]|uniref:Uncharacterized protein n=1 Tax=Toxocara canis TaxID=6265 RepID=A0A0B2V0B0_TOXCA|nr:hypothetical protein Tcan_06597 [Toxocara canis]
MVPDGVWPKQGGRFIHVPGIRVQNDEGGTLELQTESTQLLASGSAVIGSDSSDSISALLRSTSTSSINVSSEETQYSCPLQGSVKDIFDSDTCVTAISLSPFNEHQNRVVSQADLYADVTRRMDRIANTVNM